jgi:hypothetical protein
MKMFYTSMYIRRLEQMVASYENNRNKKLQQQQEKKSTTFL